jgi:threonine synthase
VRFTLHPFEHVIDESVPATTSIVRRYCRALQVKASPERDETYKQLLAVASCREGSRIFPLLEYKGVQIYLLDETSLMHTGTMRSLTGCVISTKCLHAGFKNVVFESGGNSGSALAEYCGRLGINSFFFLPAENIHLLDSTIFERSQVHLLGVDRPSKVKESAEYFARLTGFERIPKLEWRYEASAYRGLFILEHMIRNGTFDWISQTVSAAFGPLGIYSVFNHFRSYLDKLPHFLGVQQRENAPLYQALQNRDECLTQPEDSTDGLLSRVLYDIAPQTYGTVDAVHELLKKTDGCLTTLDRDGFRTCRERLFTGSSIEDHLSVHGLSLPQRNGEPIEKIGLMALFGTIKEIDAGTIKSGQKVLCCFTGGMSHADGLAEVSCCIPAGSEAEAVKAYAESLLTDYYAVSNRDRAQSSSYVGGM